MRRIPSISKAILACAVLLLADGIVLAQEQRDQEQPEPAQSSDQATQSSDELAALEAELDELQDGGYPVERERVIGTPTDVGVDLNTSFPQKDSLFDSAAPGAWFDFKEKLYEKANIKLSVSYQSNYMNASDTLGLLDSDYAWGGWFLAETKWNAFRKGKDFAGSLTATFDSRHTLGNGGVSSFYGTFGVGSLWATDIAWDQWDFLMPVFYWEQWFTKDVFVLRFGKQLAAQTYDFFRFKDSRNSFTSMPFTTMNSVPYPAFGQGVAFEWWPVKDSKFDEFYVLGTLNDMNGDPERFGLDTFFEDRQYFYGLEIGYFWKRKFPADFDHVHLDVFYADERLEPQVPGFPNKAGWGFKLMGSKQRRRLVGFGSYTYNTAEGGGFSLSLSRHTIAAGLALLKPAGIRGEIGVGVTWADPHPGLEIQGTALEDQWGMESYWKILVTPDLWLTPGVQLIWNPSLNPNTDFVAVGQVKFRLFL